MKFDEVEVSDATPSMAHGTTIGYGQLRRGSGIYGRYEHQLVARLVPVGRSKRKRIEIRVCREEEYVTWKSWDDVKSTIDKLTEDMTNWTIELESIERDHGDGSYAALIVVSWRTPTPDEAEVVRTYLTTLVREAEDRQREADERLLADLKRRRPDLLP